MIKIRDLSKKFEKTLSLDSVTLDFAKGDSVALMGANGAGKTTLIRSILGYYHPNSGSVLIKGLDPVKERTEVLKYISFVPQLPPPIKLSLSELIYYVCKSSGVDEKQIYHYADKMKLDVRSNLNKSFFKLSGGMKQKLLIAISLAKESEIVIYDEPTANLDPKARDDFYNLVQEQNRDKLSLFVTHRIEEVESLVNREIYMDMGKVVSDVRS
ncbi:Nitrous oxide reductase maturation protein NosF (ATPase) [hydrothermal vent metagenome]|uniref:Nitrous oxide reductase maturation protein NosF (ATPase) n=1 Tax=hydrothermal vent metagenome TaxID=652676 RepID=A0A1W1EBP1_9ZZZZ